MVAPYILLVLAIASVWLPRLPPVAGRRFPVWPVLFAAALILATFLEIVGASGLLSIAAFLILLGGASVLSTSTHQTLRGLLDAAAVGMLFGFAIQLFPGFKETPIISGVYLSPDASRMRFIARFDVGTAALFLAALFSKRVGSIQELRAIAIPTIVIGAATTAVVMTLAVMAGYIRFDPKWPSFALIHLGKTLLVTAVLEEAFFRGVLQDRLSRLGVFRSSGIRKAVPVLLSAALFGLAHLHGGWLLAALAAIAGLGYSLSYALTGRIEAPVAVHFLVNATHFIAFTYPNLAVTP